MPTGEQNSDAGTAARDACNRAKLEEGGSTKAPRRRAKKNMPLLSLLATLVIAVAGLAQEPKTAPAPAASDKNMTEEQANAANIELMRQDIRAQRKQIVAANMQLTAEEATKFWPVYDRYISETIKVNDARYALIKDYAQSFSNLTNTQADSFIKRWLALDRDNTELRLKYIPQFETVISPKKTALFFQIDRRLGMLIELQLASQVPVVQP